MIPTAIGPMMPARMIMEDSVSASDRKVKKDIKMRISMTAGKCQHYVQHMNELRTDLMAPRMSGSLGPLRRLGGGFSVRGWQKTRARAMLWSWKFIIWHIWICIRDVFVIQYESFGGNG